MLRTTISRHLSKLTILALLPAAIVVGQTVPASTLALEEEGTQLIGQLEDVARDMNYNADQLNALGRNSHVSSWTHYHHLEQIKSLVNSGLRPALDRLTEIRPDLPMWKQGAIDDMLASAKALAGDTNSAILNKNAAGLRPVTLNGEYQELISRIMEHSEALVKTSDAAGDMAKAHLKASEAGLEISHR
jgi:hypothetical protein